MRVRNLSRGGALVESVWPLQPGALHTVRLESDRGVGTLQARVCHVTEQDAQSLYLIGLEFVAIDAPALDDIDRFVHQLPGSASTEAS